MPTYQISIESDNRKEIVVENAKNIKNDIAAEGSSGKKQDDDSLKKEERNTFFHEEYYKADLIVNALDVARQKNSERGENEVNSNGTGKEKKSNSTLEFKSKNNIIVFSGDRGTGKTSAMVSFGKYLERIEDSNEKPKYKLLDMVDPSYFRKNESILLNIITIMFKMAKQYHDKDCHNNTKTESNRSDFNELLKKFEKVFRSVKKMDSIVHKEDSLEYLNELSEAIDLNKTIYDLIKQFLKFFDGAPQYLVLMIDDLDMNVSFASSMLEQIRKFLILDNVIILIATNIDQLQFEMKEYYSKYYDKILDPAHLSVSVSVDVEDMATKYLLKLFPPLQRIHIGDAANKLIDTNLEIKGVFKGEKEVPINDELQRVILNLIWKKTRLIFIPDNDQLHPIIPTNLRALHQLIYLLLNMKDIAEGARDDSSKLFKGENEYKEAQKNFNKFKDYILNVWIPSNVSFDEQKVFDNIPKDISRINKHLIQSINVIGSKYKKSILIKELDPKEIYKDDEKNKFDRDIYTFVSPNDLKFSHANKISDVFNFPSNNAAGDILLLIDKYKTYFEADNQNNFIEAVKIYYSLLLFETMFFGSTVKNSVTVQAEKVTLLMENVKTEDEKVTDIVKIKDKDVTLYVKYITVKERIINVQGKNITLRGKDITIEGGEVGYIKKTNDGDDPRVEIVRENITINEVTIEENGESIVITGDRFTIQVEQYTIEDVKAISNIQRLIGGTLFFPHYFNIIKDSKYNDLKETNKKEKDKLKKILEKAFQMKEEKGNTFSKAELKLEFIKILGTESSSSLEEKAKNVLTMSPKEIRKEIGDLIKEDKNKPSENYLFYHSFDPFVPEILFYIVYYGRSRPERSYGTQIYDTKEVDIKEEAFKYRFDILSLLVNSLNPYQTIARYAYNPGIGERKSYETTIGKIEKWDNYNKINDTLIPNSILPIYSVDLMLRYLKEQFDVIEIDNTFSEKHKEISQKTDKEKMKELESAIRGKEFISKYYDKLNKLTNNALEKIELNDQKISDIYDDIYEEGLECFIIKDQERMKRRVRLKKIKEILNENRTNK